MYSLKEKPVKSLAVANDFVCTTNKACYSFGKDLKPFTIYAGKEQKQAGVLDFALFEGLLDKDTNIAHEIANYWKDEQGKFVYDMTDPLQVKLLVYDYLMSISVCYVEVPKYITKSGYAMASYDKYLCTRNSALMSVWLGVTEREAEVKYANRIARTQQGVSAGELRFVKLTSGARGNTVSVPRNPVNVEKMVCIPLYMLNAFLYGAKEVFSSGIVEFTYLKDNGQHRVLPTTTSKDILLDYYKDESFVAGMLSGVDLDTTYYGGLRMSSVIHRGYVKVPEVGSSIYDGTGVRSLNIARLLSAKKVDKVDRSFIRVDLDSVVPSFLQGVDTLLLKHSDRVVDCYKQLLQSEAENKNFVPELAAEAAKEYVQRTSVFLSTEFHRRLHMFMILHPEWFPNYIGMPIAMKSGVGNYGIESY